MPIGQVRNVGIVAHVDAGKTTTTEQLLYVCGRVRRPGSVDRGTSQTDHLPEERSRGITIRAAATELPWRGHAVHLIDTPSHVDFAPEVRRALAVLDGAVLIVSAADGVQPHTERLWRHLEALARPVLIVVNKMDAEAADPEGTVRDVQALLSPRAVPVQVPLGATRGFAGVHDLLAGRRLTWEGTDAREVVETAGPAPVAVRESLVAAVAETDDALAERYLQDADIPAALLRAALARAVRAHAVFPVLLAAAARGIGMQPLLDAVVDLLPPPGGADAGPFAARVFKVDRDPVLGKVAHTCVLTGTVRPREPVGIAARGVTEKVTLIRALQGAPRGDVAIARAGDIVALFGLSVVRNGDALGGAPDVTGPGLASSVTTVRARLSGGGTHIAALVEALNELEDEDPDLRVEWSDLDREARLAVMGPVHAEFLQSQLHGRYGLRVDFDQPTAAVVETIAAPCTGSASYTGVLGDPCFGARIQVRLEPLARGGGLEWRSRVRNLPPAYEAGARDALPDCLRRAGPLRGRPVVDVRVVLTDATWSPLALSGQSTAGDFRYATAGAVQAALAACDRPVLLEPVLAYELVVPEACVARVLAYLCGTAATFALGSPDGSRVPIQGEIPAAAAWEAPVQIAALSKGMGFWDARLARYREVDPGANAR